MSVHEEQSSIEVGIMVHAETGECRVNISLSDGTILLFNAEQADAVINSLTARLAEIKAQPYRAVDTLQ